MVAQVVGIQGAKNDFQVRLPCVVNEFNNSRCELYKTTINNLTNTVSKNIVLGANNNVVIRFAMQTNRSNASKKNRLKKPIQKTVGFF